MKLSMVNISDSNGEVGAKILEYLFIRFVKKSKYKLLKD